MPRVAAAKTAWEPDQASLYSALVLGYKYGHQRYHIFRADVPVKVEAWSGLNPLAHAIIVLMYDIALIAAAGLVAALLVFLRTNAAIVFLSLCAGSLLLKYAGSDVNLAANAFSANGSSLSTEAAQLTVLLLPALLTAGVLHKSVSGLKWLFNIGPAISVGVVGILLTVPLLSGGLQGHLVNSTVWHRSQQYQDFIIAVSITASLVVLWLTAGKKHGSKHGKHH